MTSAFIGLAQIIDFARMETTKNDILDCVSFFCHYNSVFAFLHHTDVGVAVLSHLSHRLLQLRTRAQWRAAWDHVQGHTHHGLMPFSRPHSGCESTHWLYFAPYQTQRREFLAGDILLHNTAIVQPSPSIHF